MNIIQRAFENFTKGFDKKPILDTFTSGYGYTSSTPLNTKKLYYGIVYSCIDLIASNVSSTNYSLYVKGKDGKEIEKHPILDLLNRPNDFMTGRDLFYVMTTHLNTHGISYTYMIKSGVNKIVELWPLDPSKLTMVKGENYIDGYIYTNPKGLRIPMEVGEVLPIYRPNPFDIYAGISPIEMARYAQENDYHAINWNKQFFANGAVPSGVLSLDNFMPMKEFQEVKRIWHRDYEGVGNAHKTALLNAGFKYNQISPKQKDMDFLESRRFNRDEILSIFKVPKSLVAINDDVNRASAEVAEYAFAKRVLEPTLKLIEEKLNRFFVPLFDSRLELEFENVIPENKEYLLLEKTSAVNKWRTVNEIRSDDGLEPVEGGDFLYTEASQLPIGQPIPEVVEPVIPEPTPEEEIKKKVDELLNKQEKGVARTTRDLLVKRNIFLFRKNKEYKNKLRQHLRLLASLIKKHHKSFKGIVFKKDESAEHIFNKIIPDLTNWKGLLVKIMFDTNLEVMKQSIKDTEEVYSLPEIPSLEHSGAISWLNTQSRDAAEYVISTIVDQAKNIISDEMGKENMTLDKITNAILNRFDELEDYRAERIARTELIDSYSEGSLIEYKSSGIVEKKKWLADGQACSICLENEANGAIDINDSFSSGDDAPTAHPNCECCLIPVFE